MAYTKSIAIEQIYLRVLGGKPTQQSTVKREDIEPYLSAAIFWAWGLEIDKRVQDALRNKRLGINKPVNFDDLRITQCLTPQYDDKKASYYVDLPNGIPTVGGIMDWEISPVQGTESIYKINKQSDLVGMDDSIGGIMYAYYMKNPTAKIYIQNMSDACEVQVTTAFDITSIGDADILPIPSDKETMVIEKSVEFFTGQRLFPDDKKVDQIDNAKQQMQR